MFASFPADGSRFVLSEGLHGHDSIYAISAFSALVCLNSA